MGKVKALITLGAIAGLIAIASFFKTKNMKNYIFTALVALLVGGLVGWYIHKCEPVVKYLAGETIIKYTDTCDVSKIIAEISTETKSEQSTTTKPGKPVNDSSTFPIEEVSVQDTDVVTTFNKSYNTGLMRMNVKVKVTAKSVAKAKIDMEYVMDTTVLKELTTIVNTIVVSEDSVDNVPTEVIKYLPFESTSKQTWIGVGGSFKWNEKPVYDLGLNLQNGKTTFGLYVDPLNIKELEAFRLQLNRNLFRVSK